jgi:hypothetical protein
MTVNKQHPPHLTKDFIKQAKSHCGSPVAPSLSFYSLKTMAPIKVGLMGYGFSTKCFHLPFITPNPDLEVYAFLQRAEAPADKTNLEPGKHCTVNYPKAKHYRTTDTFFADPDIELVIVCTSSDNHAEFAEKAMRSGKHGMSARRTLRTPCTSKNKQP